MTSQERIAKGRKRTVPEELPWSRWYREAREDMAFRFGLRRLPVDTYKEQYALGLNPVQASNAIYRQMQAKGIL